MINYIFRYGRVKALVLCNCIGASATLLTSVSNSVGEFFFYRFMAGVAFDNNFVMMYVLGELSFSFS